MGDPKGIHSALMFMISHASGEGAAGRVRRHACLSSLSLWVSGLGEQGGKAGGSGERKELLLGLTSWCLAQLPA